MCLADPKDESKQTRFILVCRPAAFATGGIIMKELAKGDVVFSAHKREKHNDARNNGMFHSQFVTVVSRRIAF
jgi:orotate phosphoribosyltransferase-like protein